MSPKNDKKPANPVPPQTVVPQAVIAATTPVLPESVKKIWPVPTPATYIWLEIYQLPIEMFGLPGQTVEQHCSPVPIGDPNKLYVMLRSSAVLPSLEVACGNAFTAELAGQFVAISRAAPDFGLGGK